MERKDKQIDLTNEFTLNISKNKNIGITNNDDNNLKEYFNSIDFQEYWYQGYACKGKEMVMKIRQTVAWFNDDEFPYSTTVLPGNAVRISTIKPRTFPDVLDNLRKQMQTKFKQKFNTLLVEKFDPRIYGTPFLSCAFSKEKESWVENNTKIAVTVVGDSAPDKVGWLTKVPVEVTSTDKDTGTEKTSIKQKFTKQIETNFKNRTIAFQVENVKEWKFQMPYKRSSSSSPFYVLSFKCLDRNKVLGYLRNNFTVGFVAPTNVLKDCVVHKYPMNCEEKKKYVKLAKNFLYINSNINEVIHSTTTNNTLTNNTLTNDDTSNKTKETTKRKTKETTRDKTKETTKRTTKEQHNDKTLYKTKEKTTDKTKDDMPDKTKENPLDTTKEKTKEKPFVKSNEQTKEKPNDNILVEPKDNTVDKVDIKHISKTKKRKISLEDLRKTEPKKHAPFFGCSITPNAPADTEEIDVKEMEKLLGINCSESNSVEDENDCEEEEEDDMLLFNYINSQ